MKIKLLALSFIFILLTNCNTYKQANTALVSGDFQQAFEQSYQAYIKNPSEKNGLKYLPLINESYHKGQQQDELRLKEIEMLSGTAKYKEAYLIINRLQERQKNVAGLQGRLVKGKDYYFKTKDYSSAYKSIQEKYAQFLYDEGLSFLDLGGKLNAQTAYYNFKNLESVYPNYRDARILMNSAKQKGMYKVLVQLRNNTEVVIPKRLEADLLNFDSYGMNSEWTNFYTGQANSSFDYIIELSFEQVFVSPEQEKIETHTFEKDIVDGKEELKKDGKVVKDKDDKPIMVDRYVKVRGRFEEIRRVKEAAITARYYLVDNQKQQPLESMDLISQFVFSDSAGKFTGDKRVLERSYLDMLSHRLAFFPSNEQMIFDCGQDLKRKFKNQIIKMKI